jgi:SAM-dependent methyltransferase
LGEDLAGVSIALRSRLRVPAQATPIHKLRAWAGTQSALQPLIKPIRKLRAWSAASPSTRSPRLIRAQLREHGLKSVVTKSYLYDEAFFQADEPMREGYAGLADFIFDWSQPASACDLGCGRAFILEHLARKGIDVTGIDGSPAVLKFVDPAIRSRIQIADLTKRHDFGSFDLAISIEVAEHLPKRASRTFVQNLTRAATRHIVFSAAGPGQGGCGHVNCQPQDFWIRLFEGEAWRYDEPATEWFSSRIRGSVPLMDAAPWLDDNFMLFVPASPLA